MEIIRKCKTAIQLIFRYAEIKRQADVEQNRARFGMKRAKTVRARLI